MAPACRWELHALSCMLLHTFGAHVLLNVCIRVGKSCIVMYSILQNVKELTKKLCFVILSRMKTSFHAKFQLHCPHGLLVLVLIISFTRNKRVDKNNIMYLCSRFQENLFTCKIASSFVLW